MALQYTVRPISDRTPFLRRYTGSQFTVAWSQALDLLEREYGQLRGKHLVIEVDIAERGIRNDGQLRSDAKSSSPAVRVAFDSKHGPITMATDRFVRGYGSRMEDWQHNVYAIAKALEALRLVDRYGVSRSGEQYRGYKAIGAGTGLAPTSMTTAEAVDLIRDLDPNPENGIGSFVVLLRRAKAVAHPDRNDGERALWNKVEEAEQVLRRAGQLT
jgi:hypothetical protein